MRTYPAQLKVEGKDALVVGGGPVAAAKARALVEGGARVRIVAPRLSREMEQLIRDARLPWIARDFVPGDLDSVWIAVGATDDSAVCQRVFEEAERRRVLVCIADDPGRSNFILPAVLRRGDLVVTVSTSGTAPAFAARLRDYVGEILGEQYGAVLPLLGSLRDELKARYPEFGERRAAWYRLLDSEILPALRRGQLPALRVAGAKREEEVLPG
ncbi:MAG: precorrin-2 dehydrogenase [Acidobacteria bacterium]|nr:MAG: precorrin-2 dehydrogenase [Acidobacteriota bacterium]